MTECVGCSVGDLQFVLLSDLQEQQSALQRGYDSCQLMNLRKNILDLANARGVSYREILKQLQLAGPF